MPKTQSLRSSESVSTRVLEPKPNLSPVKQELMNERLAKWNKDQKQKFRRFKDGDPLPFDAVHILPVMRTMKESYPTPGGEQAETVKRFPDATSIQLKLRQKRIAEDRNVVLEPLRVVIQLPSNSIEGDHITAGLPSEALVAAILTDPNWCQSYYIYPMSEEEILHLGEVAQSEEVREQIERRKRMRDEIESQNVAEMHETLA